jgi:hypothetical protein
MYGGVGDMSAFEAICTCTVYLNKEAKSVPPCDKIHEYAVSYPLVWYTKMW